MSLNAMEIAEDRGTVGPLGEDAVGRASVDSRRVVHLGNAAAAFLAATVAGVGSASIAAAHPGHGASGWASGFAHPVGGLDHVLAAVVVGALAALVGYRGWRVVAGFVAAMPVGIGWGAATGSAPLRLSVSHRDAGFALFLVVAGAVVVWSRERAIDWRAATALAAVGGLLQGAAHGSEASTPGVAFVGGVLLATAMLHAAGAILGHGVRERLIARSSLGSAFTAAGLVLLATGAHAL